MPFDKKHLKAVIFDYGNTLVEFGRMQIMFCDTALAGALEKHFGKPDLAKLHEIRNRDRLAPYAGDPPEYRENNLVEISVRLVRELYGTEPTPEALADILHARFETFVRVVQAPDYAPELLKKLRRRYKLGILSNYPDGEAIRESLTRIGLAPFFDAVVVSGDLGLVKPHPVPFITVLVALGVKAGHAVVVGDNWLADVQGAKRAGLRVIQSLQWQSPEDMPRRPGDAQPDATLNHLTELGELL
jgi:HAD superfamily hydrolase (TIGR01549 family)